MKKVYKRGFNASRLIAFFAFAVASTFSFAQTNLFLETEISNFERAISRQGVTAEDRHSALVNLARLRQLSGDIEGAAKNWLEAAAAIPGKVDDDALLNCAYCLAAMGEWERASAALAPLYSRYKRARFLNSAINSIQTGSIYELEYLSDNPDYFEMKAEILFIIWKLTGEASWKNLLVNEFPDTVEGRLAAGANQTSADSVLLTPAPFWFFLNGLDSLAFTASESFPLINSSSISQTASAPAASSSAANNVRAESLARLQTGIFSQRTNAQNQADRLIQAGFNPLIEQRVLSGGAMWAVTVPAGENENRAIQELRAAGFESFPIR
ncbi:MAG: SPOR domain-containing protein [Treponema sp.]|nr:SPOR domain-containing protein [Treponema sp.]